MTTHDPAMQRALQIQRQAHRSAHIRRLKAQAAPARDPALAIREMRELIYQLECCRRTELFLDTTAIAQKAGRLMRLAKAMEARTKLRHLEAPN